MLFESAHVRVALEHGTATVWLSFPDEPVNALDLARLRELDAALGVIDGNPFVWIVVVRSAKPAGFCAGVHPAALASLTTDADRAAFARYGQRALGRLAGLDAVTVAFIDGPCLGAGLELALACDHRLCVSRPDTHLGFPDAADGIPPGFGGTARLRDRIGQWRANQLLTSGRTLSGREARALGLVDDAFCERRAKIELRTFLDRLERSDRLPRRQEVVGLADERRRFARTLGTPTAQAAIARRLDELRPHPSVTEAVNPVPPFPDVIGVIGDDEDASRIAAEVALRGGRVIVRGSGSGVFRGIAVALARGFVTPLEAEQARGRVEVSESLDGFGRAGLVLAAEDEPLHDLADAVGPRCVVAAAPSFAPVFRGDPDAVAALAVWLRPFGITPAVAESIPDAELVAA
jgi:enoyl-CoA hydratase/carnithine racemase